MSKRISPYSSSGAFINAVFCAVLVAGLVVFGFTESPSGFLFAGILAVLDVVFWRVYLVAKRKEARELDVRIDTAKLERRSEV